MSHRGGILSEINIIKLKGWEEVEDEAKRKLILKSNLLIYDNEKLLYLEGQEDIPIFIILEGNAILSKFSETGDEKILYIFRQGELINELALDGLRTSNSTRALKDAILLSVKASDLLELMLIYPQLNILVIKSLTKKVRRTQRQALNLGRLKTGQRIAAKLWKLSRDFGIQDNEGSLIDLNINRTDIAAMVGTSRETVSRFLSTLEKAKVITCRDNKIIIKDADELLKYVKEQN